MPIFKSYGLCYLLSLSDSFLGFNTANKAFRSVVHILRGTHRNFAAPKTLENRHSLTNFGQPKVYEVSTTVNPPKVGSKR
jgi:hypothetical protein